MLKSHITLTYRDAETGDVLHRVKKQNTVTANGRAFVWGRIIAGADPEGTYAALPSPKLVIKSGAGGATDEGFVNATSASTSASAKGIVWGFSDNRAAKVYSPTRFELQTAAKTILATADRPPEGWRNKAAGETLDVTWTWTLEPGAGAGMSELMRNLISSSAAAKPLLGLAGVVPDSGDTVNVTAKLNYASGDVQAAVITGWELEDTANALSITIAVGAPERSGAPASIDLDYTYTVGGIPRTQSLVSAEVTSPPLTQNVAWAVTKRLGLVNA